jgi:ABC-type thiamin/hydroxymethylpyrimidine transport system permease subunit
LDSWFDPSLYRMLFGSDYLVGVFRNSRSRKAAALLQGLSPEALDQLSQLARINAVRTGFFFKAVAVCYISLPLGFAALVSEVAPDAVRSYVIANADRIARVVIALILGPTLYFCAHWRAKQISWTIDVFRAGALAPAEPARSKRAERASSLTAQTRNP